MKTRGSFSHGGSQRVPRPQMEHHSASVDPPAGVPNRNESGSLLLDVIDRALDKGVMIDAWACVPVAGLNLITLDARAYVASFDRYLLYAETLAATPLVALPQPPAAETATAGASTQAGLTEHISSSLAHGGRERLGQGTASQPEVAEMR